MALFDAIELGIQLLFDLFLLNRLCLDFRWLSKRAIQTDRLRALHLEVILVEILQIHRYRVHMFWELKICL